jgi:NAD-dependent deacetylase
VFPAADLPALAKETGAKLVIINNEPTTLDHLADLVINRDISEVFLEITL